MECSSEASSTVLKVIPAMSFTGDLRILNSNPTRQKKDLKHGLPASYMDGLAAGKWVAAAFTFAVFCVSHTVNVFSTMYQMRFQPIAGRNLGL